MKQSFAGLCSEFANKARYHLALVPLIPNNKILEIMSQEGWKRGDTHFTQQQIAGMIVECGHGVPYIPESTIYNASGQDAVYGADPSVREQYDTARRNAAAIVYGITT